MVEYLLLLIKELQSSTFLHALISCEKQIMCFLALRKINGKFEDKNEEPADYDFHLQFSRPSSKYEQKLN